MLNYRIHLIRHGMTKANLEARYTGRQDIPLCEEGIEEIKKTIEVYDYPYVDMVYCSPLKRARQTAELIYPDQPITLVEDMVEVSLGDFEGKLIDELALTDSFMAWIEDAIKNPPPNAVENVMEFSARICRGLNDIFVDMTRNKYMDVAVICHGGVVSGLLSQFGYPHAPISHWKSGNISGYTISMSTHMWMSMGTFEIMGIIGKDAIDKR